MVNNTSINTNAVNQGGEPSALSQGLRVFNGFNMCTENFSITSSNYKDVSYELETNQNPFIDGGVVLSHLLHEKSITIGIVIKGDSTTDLDSRMQERKKAINKTEGLLEITSGSDVYVIKASVTTQSYDNMPFGSTNQTGSISFIAVNPARFYSKIPQTKGYTNVTNDFKGEIINEGTSNTYPIYYINFESLTGSINNVKISLGGYLLEVNQTLVQGDSLVVNGDVSNENGAVVLLNDIEIDYSGPIDTPLIPGSNPIEFGFTSGAVFSCSIFVLFQKYID